MLDQTFSSKNLLNIYTLENRKGKIPKESMSEDFLLAIKEIQVTNKELKELMQKKKDRRTEEDVVNITRFKEKLKTLRVKKQECLHDYMDKIANKINGSNFRFHLIKVVLGSKVGFKIDSGEHAQLFAMKQLQYNLQKAFKVKQANRHFIMANIKLLLNTRRPFYIIRTDVSSFFESISQERLLHMVMDNTLLSYKSKVFVKAILEQYEKEKQKLTNEERYGIKNRVGVPRGIGISSLLSEIYMRDLDSTIRKRQEVIFYVRYVDDIFIVLTQLPHGKTKEEYYQNLENEFQRYDLTLKPLGDEKGYIIDCTTQNTKSQELTYLGYKLIVRYVQKHDKKISNCTEASFHLSKNKYNRTIRRIENAFKHFNSVNKYDLHQARKDLVDSLKLITGNVKLHKSKSGIKTGFYFNSDLLDENSEDLNNLNSYLHGKKVSLYDKLFSTSEERKKYEETLYKRIKKFDFIESWKHRKMYSLSENRLRNIMMWLNYETQEDKTTL